jgi:TetR/AcrR family transcriptional regulator
VEERDRYDEKLTRILKTAAAIFARKGYHQASIRDLAAETEVSLSGLYYYFSSKEELLFLIQDHCFATLLERMESALEGVEGAEDRLRTFVHTHLSFFASSMDEMRVLSHEEDVLTGEFGDAVLDKKRVYVRRLDGIVSDLIPEGSTLNLRTATFSLFGMMNWLYTWYRPERHGEVSQIASQMAHIFLAGLKNPGFEGIDGAESASATESAPFWPET